MVEYSGLGRAGLRSRFQPAGRSLRSSRSTRTEYAELVVSPREYGSVTRLVTTAWVLGAYTVTSKRYRALRQALLPRTLQTPPRSRRIATRCSAVEPAGVSSRATSLADRKSVV